MRSNIYGIMISVIILTKNEENDLASCLDSVRWSNDIHILDSGSNDKTIEIATTKGINIERNVFESFAKQRNFAIDNIKTKHTWILFLDADELVTDRFHKAILNATSVAPDDIAGFYCCWKMILEGKWLKYSDNFPKWQFRLVRKGRARFIDFGHGQKESNILGKIEYIKEPYLHHGFSKGWSYWIERHNKYSTQEAIVRSNYYPPFVQVFSIHGSIRNSALKCWLSRFSGWPFLRFFYSYILRFGFIEGRAGFIYCANISYYEFLIQIKMREIKKQKAVQKQHR